MTKRAGSDFHARYVRVGQTLQARAVAEVGVHLFIAQPADLVQAGVLRHHAVPLAQHHVVAVRRMRVRSVEVQVIAIKHREQFHNRKCTADVNCRTGERHVENGLANADCVEFFHAVTAERFQLIVLDRASSKGVNSSTSSACRAFDVSGT